MFNNIRYTSIQRKLMHVILLTCSLALVLMCTAYVVFEYYAYKNSIKNDVSTLGIVIASNSTAALAFDSPQDATEILNALRANKHVVSACLYTKDGKQFARYPEDISSTLLPSGPQQSGYRFESGFLIGFQPVMQHAEQMGTLFIKCDLEAMYAQLQHILLVAGLLIACSLLIAFFVSRILQKSISEPILSLEKAARVVTRKHDYTIRAIKTSDDEIGSLTDAFNQMLLQIEKQNAEIIGAQQASSKLAAIVESSIDAIIGESPDGRITSWNNAAERMFAFTALEMIGAPVSKVFPSDVRIKVIEILQGLKNTEQGASFDTQIVTRNNKSIHVSITISLVRDANGNIIGLSKIVRDITEKKQEEMRKNDFVAIVSHELKTPLTSIQSYIQLLLAIAKKEESAFGINALTRTEVQIKKMSNMIQDFLNLARLEDGKIQLEKEEFELQPFIEEIVNESQFLTTNHKVVFDGCNDITVFADKEKISQVLINLLSNAIKYSPAGGTITVSCAENDGRVIISVIDEGVGISADDQKKLFNRFYRVKNEKVKTVSGFGIGLYLVAEIVRIHGSNIQVKSEEGIGSNFYFDLEAVLK